MKRYSSPIITIPAPCHESWDNMTAAEQGKFCQSCQKIVTDFSSMSDQELLSFLANANKNICGRFNNQQLHREISLPVNTRKQPFISVAAMAAALTISIPSVQGKNNTPLIQMMSSQSAPAQQSDTLPRIIGIVREGSDSSLLPEAFVKIKDYKMYAATDSTGKFEFRIPFEMIGKKITVEVEYPRHLNHNVTITVPPEGIVLEIPMERIAPLPTGITMGAVAVVTTESIRAKKTLWQRFKCSVGELFH